MKRFFLITTIFIALSSFAVHKFYSGIFQIEHNTKKKRIEITSHLFIDDVEKTLEKKYGRKYHFGTAQEQSVEWEDFKKYLETHFHIMVNGKEVKQQFNSKECDGDEIIIYSKVENIPAIKTLKVQNNILMEEFPKQQNTIQVKFNNKKQSAVLKEGFESKVFK